MKKGRFLVLLAVAVIVSAGVAFAQNVTDPVVAGSVNVSALPDAAKSFINKHYKGVAVIECEKGFLSGKYDVELADDTDIDFDSKGNVIDIDAGGNNVLSLAVLKDILPSKAISELEKRGQINIVESVKRTGRGYKVELRKADPDEVSFAADGTFISIR